MSELRGDLRPYEDLPPQLVRLPQQDLGLLEVLYLDVELGSERKVLRLLDVVLGFLGYFDDTLRPFESLLHLVLALGLVAFDVEASDEVLVKGVLFADLNGRLEVLIADNEVSFLVENEGAIEAGSGLHDGEFFGVYESFLVDVAQDVVRFQIVGVGFVQIGCPIHFLKNS